MKESSDIYEDKYEAVTIWIRMFWEKDLEPADNKSVSQGNKQSHQVAHSVEGKRREAWT